MSISIQSSTYVRSVHSMLSYGMSPTDATIGKIFRAIAKNLAVFCLKFSSFDTVNQIYKLDIVSACSTPNNHAVIEALLPRLKDNLEPDSARFLSHVAGLPLIGNYKEDFVNNIRGNVVTVNQQSYPLIQKEAAQFLIDIAEKEQAEEARLALLLSGMKAEPAPQVKPKETPRINTSLRRMSVKELISLRREGLREILYERHLQKLPRNTSYKITE